MTFVCIGHSCLIARNLLSGLKTCIEVANYMYNNGAAMAKRPLLNKSISGDFAENEQDYMVCTCPARLCALPHRLVFTQLRKVNSM
jgi:hypothetical protein